jgi:ribosomal protein L29
MTMLKFSEIKKMTKEERKKKLKELKMELIKANVHSSKGGSSKIKMTKKIIAKLLTLDKSGKEELRKK